MLTVDLVPRIALSVEGIGPCYTEISVHTMPGPDRDSSGLRWKIYGLLKRMAGVQVFG
jgi:hypothetical protein